MSVDLPSGLDADRGIPIDAGPALVIVRADYTVTFGFPSWVCADRRALSLPGKPSSLTLASWLLAAPIMGLLPSLSLPR